MSSLSTHVLDTAKPKPGLALSLVARNNEVLGTATTDADGRARFATAVEGATTLRFDTATISDFFPEVVLTFVADAARPHHHVPLLLSPFAYSTYRGS